MALQMSSHVAGPVVRCRHERQQHLILAIEAGNSRGSLQDPYLAIVHVAVAKSDLQQLQSANLTIAMIVSFGKQLVCKHDPAIMN